MSDAQATYLYPGYSSYNFTPTSENPVWILVHNYTRRDIDKAANGTDFKSVKMKALNSEGERPLEPIALLRYEFDYHPAKYFDVTGHAATLDRGRATGRNPNGLDMFTEGRNIYENDYIKAKDDFRDWWMNLQDPVADGGTEARPDGRAELLRQMTTEGIVACVENLDIPAALEIIENTKAISHLNWPVYRDQLVTMLEARLVNHWHLMSPAQQAKHTQYVPPDGDDENTNSGTNSGTSSGTI